jgi:hypothetical protein
LASDPIIRVGTISAYGQAKKNGVEIVNSTISGGNTATYALTFVGDNGIISGNTFDGGTEYYGHHDGVNGSATLTDATQNWTPNSLVGKTVENIYDCGGSSGTITANTATSVTATLIGGSRQSWTNTSISSDRYVIGGSFFVGIYSEGNDITISNNTFRNAAHIERVFEPSGNRTTFSGNEIYGMNASYAGTSPCGSHVDIWQLGGVALSKDHLIEKKYIHDNASCQIIHDVINNAA